MKRTIALTAVALTSTLALAACADDTASDDAPETTATTAETATQPSDEADMHAKGHDHPADGGEPPAGIVAEENPTYPVGAEVILTADHMPGMEGAQRLSPLSGIVSR